MRIGSVLVVVVLSLLTTGCSLLPGTPSESRPGPQVSTISFGGGKDCRYLADVTAESRNPPDSDLQAGALARAQAMTAEKGGNAMQVVSMVITTSTGGASQLVLTVKAFACPASALEQ